MPHKYNEYFCRIQEGFFDGVCILRLEGRIGLGKGGTAFNSLISEKLDSGFRFFLVDCTDVTVIDSSGIGGLVQAKTRIEMRSGKFIVVCRRIPQKNSSTGFIRDYTVIEIADDLLDGLSRFHGSSLATLPEIEYEDRYSVLEVQEKKNEKSLVVSDNIAKSPSLSEYPIREIPEPTKNFSPISLIFVVLTFVVVLGIIVFGLVWVVKTVSSIALLTLIFGITLLFLTMLVAVVLLFSGHLSEKAASKLFGGILGKVPGLGSWLRKKS